MSVGEAFFIGWSLLMVIISAVYFIWAWESGQFKNIEKAKYDMLEDKEPLPWPGREDKFQKSAQGKRELGKDGGKV
jgi:cbb3-type cytochrome oxidase maturation protein